MKIDSNTGLPELPPGYFWRITDGFLFWNFKIKRRRGWFTWTVNSGTIHRAGDTGWTAVSPTYEDYLQGTARDLYLKTFRDPAIANKYLGDYPPKTIINDSQGELD